MNIIIIGTGINGLVAANYLQRNGHKVLMLERKTKTGGACCQDVFNGYTFPKGASVFGLMQDFVFQETGLDKEISVFIPNEPDIIHFPEHRPCFYYEDDRLTNELREKWNEQGDVKGYQKDLQKISQTLRDFNRQGKVPTKSQMMEQLGDLYFLWVSGSAKNLFKHYFTSELTALHCSIPVTESSPLPLDEPCSAFNIPIMNSGNACGAGKWGFVKEGIWQITEALTDINVRIGVNIITNAQAREVQDTTVICDQGKINADIVIFATDPVTAGKLTHSNLTKSKRYLGCSAKQVFFFSKPVQWKEAGTFQFVFAHNTLESFENATARVRKGAEFDPTFFEIYPEGTCRMKAGWNSDYDYFAVFFKDVGLEKSGEESPHIKDYVESLVLQRVKNTEDYVDSVLLTPKDLCDYFFFPQGNIDHMELCDGQTLFDRTFSSEPSKQFYQFGENPRQYYCGAGAYPCGSVAGTTGYLCASEILASY